MRLLALLLILPLLSCGSAPRTAAPSLNSIYQAASPGATIPVNGQVFQADYPSEGAAKLLPGPANVTFVCGDGQPITFASPADQLVITTSDVTFRGSCWHFNRVWIGDGPNGKTAANVTLDGVSMWSFNVAGSSGTIENSTIGPDVACTASGPAACQNNSSDNEAYWFQNGRGNTDYVEPMIHTIGSVNPNVQLINDHFTRLQTRDSFSMHMSCLWLGWTDGGSVSVRGTTFDGCATDDIHVDTPQSSGLLLTGSTLKHSVEPLQTGNVWDTETNVAQTELQVKCQANTQVSNYTVTNNVFEHGWDLDFGGCPGVTFPGVNISGNTGGSIRNPAQGSTPPTDWVAAAEKEFKATTITYQNWLWRVNAGRYKDPSTQTAWGRGFADLAKA